MIDWVTATIICDHDPQKLIAGHVISYDAELNPEWVVNKFTTVEGSHSAKIQIQSRSDSLIWISGNPTKFLQGHNIFGSDDLQYIMGRFFDALMKHDDLGLRPTHEQYDAIQSGEYTLTRVDYNRSWHLPNRDAVLSWIRAAGQCANLKNRGKGQFSGDTLYFGKNSTWWSLKCYSKGHELTAKKHGLPKELQIPELIEWADKSLRLEMVLRSRLLKGFMIDRGSSWTKDTGKELLLSCIRKDLQITDNMPLPDDLVAQLPRPLRSSYVLWRSGEDLRQTLSHQTFYRHRNALLAYNIDITIVQEKERNNVIPLIRYLEAEPAEIPQWAYERNLIA